MEREDVQKFLAVMQCAYPLYKPPDKRTAVDFWFSMLSQYDSTAVFAALQAYAATDERNYAPSVGQIIGQIHRLTTPGHLPDGEAWALVSRAYHDGIYHSREHFDEFPPEIKEAVGAPEQLHSWAMDENFNESVAQSNFLRAYRTACQRRDDLAKLPASVREMMHGTERGLPAGSGGFSVLDGGKPDDLAI